MIQGKNMSLRCPKCGGDNIGQYRGIEGPIWCIECGVRDEKKEDGNFFVESSGEDYRPFNGD